MTSIGESLRRAREDKGLDLDRVSDETRIAKRFLAALEAEDFSVFPGDPYAVGFLRNYAEYLGLNAAELVASFNMLRIQEQPAPIQELLPTRRRNVGLIAGVAAVVLLVLGGTAFLILRGGAAPEGESLSAPHSPTEYRLDSAPLDKRLWVGDDVVYSMGKDSWKLSLSNLTDGAILDTPLGQRRLSLGEESVLDFDGDGQPDLRILLADLDKRDPGKGANLRFTPLAAGAAPAPSAADIESGSQIAGAAQQTDDSAAAAAAAAKPDTATTTKEGAIFEGQKSSYPFVVSVTFRASCMFRYEVDRKDRDERYYQKGDTLTINANNAVKIWASNAKSASVLVQASGGRSASIDLGGPGEIAVKRIAWSQNDNGSYTLSLFEVD